MLKHGSTTWSMEFYGCANEDHCFNHQGASTFGWSQRHNMFLHSDENSYYYDAKPYFLGSNYTFPTIGPLEKISEGTFTLNITQSISARDRYELAVKTYILRPTPVYLMITLTPAQFPEGGGSGATYEVNGVNTGTGYNGDIVSGQTIKANPPNSQWAFYCWNDGNFDNPRTVQEPLDVYAKFKLIHKSTDPVAFSNNGQRRLIETSADSIWLHQVYTSLGHVWLEHSSDGGISWVIGNNGQPLDGNSEGKNPSIAYVYDNVNNYNYIGVVWQQKNSSKYKIMGKIFNQDASFYNVPYPFDDVTAIWTESFDTYNVNANPNLVMAGLSQGPYLVTFERKSTSGGFRGLNWVVGHIQDSEFNYDGPFGPVEENGVVSGTNANTTNAQLSLIPSGEIAANLIYQSASPSGAIYSHCLYLTYNGYYWTYGQFDDGMISSPSVSFNPSIITRPDNTYASCWIEYEQLVFHRLGEITLHYFDSGVRSVSINSGKNTDGGFVGWSRQNTSGTWSNKSMLFNMGEPVSGTTNTLTTAGKYVQVGNGANTDLTNIRVSSFYPFSSPYNFNTSHTLGPLSKLASKMITGRGFIILNDDATFSYRLDGLNIDGNNIDFIDVPDTMNFGEINILNNALITEPFQLNTNSVVVFNERSGFADSVGAQQILNKTDYIRYKVELIDDATGEVLGIIRNKSLDISNAFSFKSNSLKLDTKGLTTKSARIKITVETNCIRELSSKTPVSSEIPLGINLARFNKNRLNIFLTKSTLEENDALVKSINGN